MCGSRKDLRVEWGALSLSNENHGGWGWHLKKFGSEVILEE